METKKKKKRKTRKKAAMFQYYVVLNFSPVTCQQDLVDLSFLLPKPLLFIFRCILTSCSIHPFLEGINGGPALGHP